MAHPQVLDATAKGAASNAYTTEEEAGHYLDSRLYITEWSDASVDGRERALKWATRLLDSRNWLGVATTTTQALRWPRSGVPQLDYNYFDEDVIPQWLIDATAELALSLLRGERTADSDTVGFSKIKVDVIELEIDKQDRPDAIPDSVYYIISDYLATSGVKLSRV